REKEFARAGGEDQLFPSDLARAPFVFGQKRTGLGEGDDSGAIQQRSAAVAEALEPAPSLAWERRSAGALAAPNLTADPGRFIDDCHLGATFGGGASGSQSGGSCADDHEFECGVRSAECGVECRMVNAECGVGF